MVKASNLAVAENRLFDPVFAHRVGQVGELDAESLAYVSDFTGTPGLRASVARFLELELLGGRNTGHLGGDALVMCSGVSGAVLIHALARVGAGNAVLLGMPSWAGLTETYRGMNIAVHGVQGDLDTCTPTCKDFRRVFDVLPGGERDKVRALVITNPSNPGGINYREHELEELCAWALTRGLDVFSDEIYCLSQVQGSVRHVSALQVEVGNPSAARVFSAWGVSKDLGAAGLKIGVLCCLDTGLSRAIARDYGRFSSLTSLQQRVAARLFMDPAGLSRDMGQQRRRLTEASKSVAEALKAHEIPFACVEAGLFFWLDLRAWLEAFERDEAEPQTSALSIATPTPEVRLDRYLEETAGVAMMYGRQLGCPIEGRARLCFTAYPITEVVSAIDRLGQALLALKQHENRDT